jgi:adenylosuccinate lyase
MQNIWENENKFQKMMEVEIAVAQAQAEEGLIPEEAAKDIASKSKFSVDRILEIENTTKHDVIAFVSNLAENVGDNGRYIHYGLTSSDVLDTAISLQLRQACELIEKSLEGFKLVLLEKIKQHSETLCAGRTHGMHAEPTTFGMKLCGYLAELGRNQQRFRLAFKQSMIVKLSGAVGTYSTQSPTVEKRVAEILNLTPETVATQVVPRDRHAELMQSLSYIACMLERLAIELRHLQRTEVYEVTEGFAQGQKGSSAMPHKKNPISSENITGVARMIRAYASASMENIALWHERDISHSSVERVFIPDAFTLSHYAIERMTGVIKNLVVNEQRMILNMNLSKGQLFSSHVLLLLVKKGLSREQAYKKVQSLSHNLKDMETLSESLKNDAEVMNLVTKDEIDTIFSGETHLKGIRQQIKKLLEKEGLR